MQGEREQLDIPWTDAELRVVEEETPKLIGYAARYGNWYDLGLFLERIKAGAFDDVLADETTDVIASMNHNVDQAFARQSAGTLRVTGNSVGLQYEADINDSDGQRIYEKVKNRTIQGSSFMFADVDDTWEFKEDELPRRTITRVGRLYELGPVVWPANTATTAKARQESILAEARSRRAETVAAAPAETATEETGEAGNAMESTGISVARRHACDRLFEKVKRRVQRARAADAAGGAPGQSPGHDRK